MRRSQAGGKRCHLEGSGQDGEVGLCGTPEINKAKCQILNLGWSNPRYTHRLGGEVVGAGLVFVCEKPSMTQQCALPRKPNES